MAILKVANIHHDASGFTRTQISTANTITWYTSNQERVILDSTGTVRVVGTVNASSILLNGVRATDISNSYAVTVGAASNTLANTKLANTTTTLAGTLTITGDAIVGGNVIFDSPASTRIWEPSVNTLAFITNSNESMRITSTGLVGIGITSPTSLLHVVGTANITSALTTSSIELGHPSDTTLARSSAGNITIEGNIIYRAGGTDVPITDGGTGASDAATARINLGLGTFKANIGNGSANTFNVNHALNSTDVIVSVKEISSGYIVYPDIDVTTPNHCVFEFVNAPSANQYRVAIIGI